MTQRKPSKAFSTRYHVAKRWRDEIEPDLKEVMRFTAPDRANCFSSSPYSKDRADTDTYISIGEEMATDLAGDLVNFYMPSEQKWAEYEVMVPIPQEAAQQVEALVNARETQLFDALDQSNFNDIKPQIMFEAGTHGTPALWVDQGHLAEPLFIETVPPNELLITPGHMGYLDRFREKWVAADFLEATLPSMNLDLPAIRRKMQQQHQWFKVCWGYWLNWSDPGNPRWNREITVDGNLVSEKEEDIGPINGSCPLLVGRFNPRPNSPWGRGPAIKALPDLLTLDKIQEVILGKLDEQLDPAWTYIDDGVLNFANGIVGGHAYPRKHEQMPEPLLAPANLDYGFFEKNQMEERIRTAFYQDGPRQRGDTPPTASQWLDERRRVQARLGKPSAPIFTELLLQLVHRTEFVLVSLGQLEQAITVDGVTLNVRPISPMQRSQNQDKALITRANLEFGFGVFQDQFPQLVDMLTTYQNYVKATGDELTILNPKQQTPNEAENPPA